MLIKSTILDIKTILKGIIILRLVLSCPTTGSIFAVKLTQLVKDKYNVELAVLNSSILYIVSFEYNVGMLEFILSPSVLLLNLTFL